MKIEVLAALQAGQQRVGLGGGRRPHRLVCNLRLRHESNRPIRRKPHRHSRPCRQSRAHPALGRLDLTRVGSHEFLEKRRAIGFRHFDEIESAIDAAHHAGQHRGQPCNLFTLFGQHAPDQVFGRAHAHFPCPRARLAVARAARPGHDIDPPLRKEAPHEGRHFAVEASFDFDPGLVACNRQRLAHRRFAQRLRPLRGPSLAFFPGQCINLQECVFEHRQVGDELGNHSIHDAPQTTHQWCARRRVGIRVGTQIGNPVDQPAQRMLPTREETAIEQGRLDRDHLQSKQLLLDRVGQPSIGINVVKDQGDNFAGHLIEGRALCPDTLHDGGQLGRAAVKIAFSLQIGQGIHQRSHHWRQWNIGHTKGSRIRQHAGHLSAARRQSCAGAFHRLIQFGHQGARIRRTTTGS